MNHTSFVASIIQSGIDGNLPGIRIYAATLAARLKEDGEDRQAAIIQRAASGALSAPGCIGVPESWGSSTYEGCWCPVYWTPIIGSGERLTVFIIARGDDGQSCLLRTIRDDVLTVSFGKKITDGLRSEFSFIEADLTAWLTTANPYTDRCTWTAPLSGYLLGGWRKTRSDNIRQLAAYGKYLGAAFADELPAKANLE